jgi:dihydroorotate dehydrogenase electron transfer subunit
MLENALVVSHERIGDPQYQIMRLVFHTDIALEAMPGQFVHVQVSVGLDPLLRRPISIAEINVENKEITLFYRIRGKGTERLAQVRAGNRLSLMGPIGRGFTIPEEGELVLIAGGIGVFPLLALAKEARKRNLSVRLYWGGESKAFFESAGLEYWKETGVLLQVSTLDGSLGERGNVLDVIKKGAFLPHPTQQTAIAVCGPNPMMQAVSDYFVGLDIAYSIEASLEERMGCAVGACLGCVCTLKDGMNGELRRAKVCKDGPVFNAKEVLWNGEI